MTDSVLGKQVSWEKIKGKPNASMPETSGFGSLVLLEVGKPMIIGGDYGLGTTSVKTINTKKDKSIVITTKNSTYRIVARY